LIERLGEELVQELKYDRALSNDHTAVWLNPKEKTVYTSVRGTADLDDIKTDVGLTLGIEQHSERFRQSRRHMQTILDRYDGQEWKHVVTGHSLGGSIGEYLGNEFKDDISEIHNFNPGSSVRSVLSNAVKAITNTNPGNVHTYHIVGDPISHLARFGRPENTTVYEMAKGTSNPHSLQQFFL
jgi:hypothetical protein